MNWKCQEQMTYASYLYRAPSARVSIGGAMCESTSRPLHRHYCTGSLLCISTNGCIEKNETNKRAIVYQHKFHLNLNSRVVDCCTTSFCSQNVIIGQGEEL